MAGELRALGTQQLTAQDSASLIDEILTPDQRAAFQKNLDLDFAYEVPQLNARFRVNVFAGRMGTTAVLRMIPTRVLSVEQLGLPPSALQLAKLKKGLVVVTGATGSGKSTTLAALIDHINKTRREHILTVEDPIEFVHQSQMSLINQREVKTHTHSFATALRAALREDPDVILVGEMRDLETIELAVTAAETGHLVFGTLHTSTAAKTVDRIINVFPAEQQNQIRVMLSESLKGVIAQNLVKTVDGKRAGAFEVMVNNQAISSLIRESRVHQIPSAMQTGKGDGNILMDEALEALIRSGRVNPQEASRFLSSEGQARLQRGTASGATGAAPVRY
jgi:twitching motility protein PilT